MNCVYRRELNLDGRCSLPKVRTEFCNEDDVISRGYEKCGSDINL